MSISALSHLFLVDLLVSLFHAGIKLSESLLVIGDRSLDLKLLDFEASDLLADTVILLLFEGYKLLSIVVFFLNVGELSGNLVDLVLDMLGCGSVVGWFEKSVGFDEGVRSVVDLELFLHDRAACALELGHTLCPFTITVHLL